MYLCISKHCDDICMHFVLFFCMLMSLQGFNLKYRKLTNGACLPAIYGVASSINQQLFCHIKCKRINYKCEGEIFVIVTIIINIFFFLYNHNKMLTFIYN